MDRITPALCLLLAACASPPVEGPVETVSLLGDELHRPPVREQARLRHEAELDAALLRWAEAGAEDDAIWVGRQLAYLGRYGEAVGWYGSRMTNFPESARLYRHRGHRLITLRRFEAAIEDLEYAWELCKDQPDEVERDGLPNAAGIPLSSLHTNVLYHLALARFLTDDLEGARKAWAEGLARSTNDDMRVANANWLVLTLRRMGRDGEAREVLEDIDLEAELIENGDYLTLLRLHAGLVSPGSLDQSRDGEVADATLGFGLGAYLSLEDRTAEGQRILWGVVEATPWASFGHIAAEADLARRN